MSSSLERENAFRSILLGPSSLVLFLLLGSHCLSQQLKQVMELRGPSVGVSRIDSSENSMEWVGFSPHFAGDVDHDGYDDFLVNEPSKTLFDHPDTILVFGGPRASFGNRVDVKDLRRTRFLASQTMFAWEYGLAWLGDLDGDGFSDFAIPSMYATWEGIQSTG